MKPGKRRLLDKEGAAEEAEKRKASVQAKVEHPFLYVKRHFGYAKLRYGGLAKNMQRIALLLGFANLLIAGRYATGKRKNRHPRRPFIIASRNIEKAPICIQEIKPRRDSIAPIQQGGCSDLP